MALNTNTTKKIQKNKKRKLRKKKLRNEKQNNFNITTTDRPIQSNKNSDIYLQEFLRLHNKPNKKRNRCSKNNGKCSQICKRKGKRKCACLKGYKLAKNHKKCVGNKFISIFLI